MKELSVVGLALASHNLPHKLKIRSLVMKISQDSFNKLVTAIMLLFAMAIFTLSWLWNRPLNLSDYSVLFAPVITHVMHLLSNKFADKNGNS